MKQFVHFRLGPDRFAIDVNSTVEIMNPVIVRGVPELPDFVSGVVSIRKALVPMIDMRARLGLKPESERERVVIVRLSRQEKVALLVDEVYGIEKMEGRAMSKPPVIFRGLKKKYLLGLIRDGEDVIMVLDIGGIITSDELIKLSEVRESLEEIEV